MHKYLFLIFHSFLFIFLGQLIQSTQAQSAEFVPGEVIVRYQEDVGAAGLDEYSALLDLADVNYQYQEKLDPLDNTFLVKLVAGESVTGALAQLKTLNEVVYAEPNTILEAFLTPNDPQWNSLWGLQKIAANQAWDQQTGSSNVTVAVVDTGVDQQHSDLQGKIVAGYDFVSNDNDPQDQAGHGTHVAGTIAAITNNNQDVAGVAGGNAAQNNWGVQIMPVRVLDGSGKGSMASVAQGIRWAVDNGAHVINLSLGDPQNQPNNTLQDAVDYAWNKGTLVVAAAGNSGQASCFTPARFDNAICVVATNSQDQRSDFSNYGQDADVAAPGSRIVSLWLGGGTQVHDGTSMATPHVAGLAGLLYSFMPNRSAQNAQAVRGCIENNLDVPQNWNSNWAPGRINALRAVNDSSCNTGAPTPTIGPTNTPMPSISVSPSPSPTPRAGRTPAPTGASPTQKDLPSTCTQADLNGDGSIDQQDLNLLINAYGQNQPDINGDNVVNQIDGSIILTCWN